MSGIRLFNVHRSWEDWLGTLIGVLVGLSWLAGHQHELSVALNAILVGALVFLLAQIQLLSPQRGSEIGAIGCGLWLIASPFSLGYAEAGTLRYWHFVLGAAVVLIAVLECWQDWALSDEELDRQGHY